MVLATGDLSLACIGGRTGDFFLSLAIFGDLTKVIIVGLILQRDACFLTLLVRRPPIWLACRLLVFWPAYFCLVGASVLVLGAPWLLLMGRLRAISIASSESFLMGPKAIWCSSSTPHNLYLSLINSREQPSVSTASCHCSVATSTTLLGSITS